MKAIMVMFDSLNRNYLSPYGGNEKITPNFKRLAEKSVTFDSCYAGSLPCIPARREIHTGRYNFLHRSWGPVEPYDDSAMEMLKTADVHCHLVSDHFHYWEDGGATYHTRFNSWELIRGEQVDPWKVDLTLKQQTPSYNDYSPPVRKFDIMNRHFITEESEAPLAQTVQTGIEFLETNRAADNWFLQIEAFDPHEPFIVPDRFYEKIGVKKPSVHFDWPPYTKVSEPAEAVEACQNNYLALLAMCDEYLGKVLDAMDRYGLWEDTMLIVNTDHGFFLGEKEWWGKIAMPCYDEVARIPLFMWDPRIKRKGEHNSSLVQTIDIAPTLLDFFGIAVTPRMQGKSLSPVANGTESGHDAVLFGCFGGHVNCTDGKYLLMKAPPAENKPLYNYTLMPTHMRGFFSEHELKTAQLSAPFDFTRGIPIIRTDAKSFQGVDPGKFGDLLFDMEHDPEQTEPIQNEAVMRHMKDTMIDVMEKSEAPAEQYVRLGLKRG